MGFWIFMLLMVELIPVAMLAIGFWFRRRPPATINFIVGYRTARSMQNEDTWRFAHQHCGAVWQKIGLVLVPLSALIMAFFYDASEEKVGVLAGGLCIVQCVVLLCSVIPTERALKRTFDESGKRREDAPPRV